MIQLAFEPAYDPYHAAFRVLQQVTFHNWAPVPIPRLKVLDLYLAEPARCTEIRLSGKLRASAKLAAECQPSIYGRRPASTAMFNRMSPIQDAAIQTLVLQGILDGDAFGQKLALRTELLLSDALEARILEINASLVNLLTFLCKDLEAIPFDGIKGLKDRTGLGEYRYDVS